MHTQRADCTKEMTGRNGLEGLLRSCVHCGFCNAVCPTYQLLGDELDGPRGRIYLIKQALEGRPVTRLTQRHLDRCLTCRSCETACPSGVKYGQLLDAGKVLVDQKAGRRFGDKLVRYMIIRIFAYRFRFNVFMSLARWIKPVFPQAIKVKIPPKPATLDWPKSEHSRTMLILPGCVQSSLAPSIDVAAARLLYKLGVSLLPVLAGGCCGALPYHLSDHERALIMARKNIDACRVYMEQGAEAVVMTASACGVMAKDYGRLLKDDMDYAVPAARFSAMVKDIGEVLAGEDLSKFEVARKKIAFQSPCTLQHGQKLNGVVEAVLRRVGFQLSEVADAHLCCGSAGVYTLLQPDLSKTLLTNKLLTLESGQPDLIATANVGCLCHLQSSSSKKVVHWIELLD